MKKLISVFILVALIFASVFNAAAADVFFEGFEDAEWTARGWYKEDSKAYPELSTEMSRTGNASLRLIGEFPVLQTEVKNEYLNKVIEVWLYDDGITNDSNGVLLMYDVTEAGVLAVGIRESISTTHYVIRLGPSSAFEETNVPRSQGWQRLVVDFSTPETVKVWINDVMVLEADEVIWGEGRNDIDVGDHWASESSGGFYMDDFRIYEGPYVPGQDSGAVVTNEESAVSGATDTTDAGADISVADTTPAPAVERQASPRTSDSSFMFFAIFIMALGISIVALKKMKRIK